MKYILLVLSLCIGFTIAYASSDKHVVDMDTKAIMEEAQKELDESDIIDKSLAVNDQAPDFKLPNVHGNKIRLYSLLKKGPAVVTFYRGGWCPYCNMQLHGLQEVLDKIEEYGANLIAISPQTPDNSMDTAEKNSLEFEVLSDVGNKVSQEYGLVFTLPEILRSVYEAAGVSLEEYNGDDKFELPVPATFVINCSGKVVYAFKDVDYKKRANPEDILKVLASLRFEDKNPGSC